MAMCSCSIYRKIKWVWKYIWLVENGYLPEENDQDVRIPIPPIPIPPIEDPPQVNPSEDGLTFPPPISKKVYKDFDIGLEIDMEGELM